MDINDNSQFDEANLTLGRVIGYLTKQYIGYVHKRMEKTPVTRYYFPLYLIGKYSGEISQQQLANKILMDKVGLVRVLDALTEEGLIERKVNPNDRRQHLLHVTESGAQWIPQIEKTLNETDALFYGFIPENERAAFKLNLERILSATKYLKVEDVELFYNRTNNKKE
jgi:MarR family transcriptional regulator for hemolysin